MAYESGTAANMPSILTALATFLTTDGWTINRQFGGSLEVSRAYTRGSAKSMGFGIAFSDGIDLLSAGVGTYFVVIPWLAYAELGFSWYDQTGHPESATGAKILGVAAPSLSTSIPYHFFSSADGEQVAIVIGRTTGVYNYLGFGALPDSDKFGAFDGWQYAFGARAFRTDGARIDNTDFNTHQGINIPPIPPGYRREVHKESTTLIRVDSDASGEEWRSCSGPADDSTYRTDRVISGWMTEVGGTRSTNVIGIGGLPSTLHLWVRSRSTLAQNVVLIPCIMSTYRPGNERWSPICRLPLVHAAFTSGALNEGAQFLIGSDTYRAFNSFAVQEIP
jgi:hypothetical protein